MIDLTIERDVDESLIHRSNGKREMLKEFSSANILQETIRFGIGGHDGKLEEGTESGVGREVLRDCLYFFRLEE